MLNLDLPFKVNDGERTRKADMTDLLIMCELGLRYHLKSTRKRWYLFRQEEDPKVLIVLYAALKAIAQLNMRYQYQYAQNGNATIVNSSNIHTVICEDLHKYRQSTLLHLLLEIELLR